MVNIRFEGRELDCREGETVLVLRALPPVWRRLVDAGVAAALSWGLVALVTTFIRVIVAPRASKPTGDRLVGQAVDIA